MATETSLIREALELTERYEAAPRSDVDRDVVVSAFLADFVAESESLEGHASQPREVLDSVRDLTLA